MAMKSILDIICHHQDIENVIQQEVASYDIYPLNFWDDETQTQTSSETTLPIWTLGNERVLKSERNA